MTLSVPTFSPFVTATEANPGPAPAAGPTGTVTAAQAASEYRDLAAFRLSVVELRDAVGQLATTLATVRVRSSGTAGAFSAADIGLSSGAAAAARLGSTEEINATPTSFTPFGPAYDGASDALATVDGVYDGANGSGTLRFRVAQGGVHGTDNARIRVNVVGGGSLGQITVNKNDPLDQVYTLVNGMQLSFGPGTFVKNDEFFVDISDLVGSAVDPDKPLDGLRNDNPNLEFGLGISTGSFEINGVSIDVNAGDTLNEVIDRITDSAAGVTASFDAGTERLELTQKTPGEGPTITLGSDSTGFFAATKLAGAVVEPGANGDIFSPLDTIPAFDAVSDGDILINGTAIAIDTAADSLRDILLRINGAGAGALATLSNNNDRVAIRPVGGAEQLVLDDNGTGFFAAIHIDNGTYERGEARLSSRAVSAIGGGIQQVSAAIENVFGSTADFRSESVSAERLRSEVKTLIADAVERIEGVEQPALLTAFDPDTALLDPDVGSLDDGRFARDLRADFDAFKRRLTGDDPAAERGFLGDLIALLDSTATDTRFELSIVGALISVYA